MPFTHKRIAIAAAVALLAGTGYVYFSHGARQPETKKADAGAPLTSVTLTDQQAKQVSVIQVSTHVFDTWQQAVGYIDYNQDDLAQISTPYTGRVSGVASKAGDKVNKGQLLYTIDSSDLLQAESTLLAADGVLTLNRKTLARAKQMLSIQASAQKDVEQAVSDEQTAEASYVAARKALYLFGKTDVDIEHVLATRKPEGELRILSPVAGVVAARNVAIGDLVQPGATPTPFNVANLENVWMVANVPEEDAAALRMHQPIAITLPALPGRTLRGTISHISSAVDPNTHTVMVRADIPNPDGTLLPQMLANAAIETVAPVQSASIPVDGVVREGDGTLMAYVTQDGRQFAQRAIKVGKQQQGVYQILEGVRPGERVAGEGALFLDNMLSQQPDDD